MWTLSWKIPVYCIYIRPCLLPLLHLTVINGGTRGSHQAALKEFQSPPSPPSPPRLQSLCTAPSLTSFYSLILPLVSISPVFCPLTLSPSISERDTWQTVCPPSLLLFLPQLVPPPVSSSYTCVSGRLSLLSRGELRWKDCFSCVYTKTYVLLSHKITLVLFGSTGAHIVMESLESFV